MVSDLVITHRSWYVAAFEMFEIIHKTNFRLCPSKSSSFIYTGPLNDVSWVLIMRSYEIYIIRSIIWNDGSVHSLQLSSLKPVSASIPICSFLYLSDSHSRSFITVFKIKKRLFQNEQQKIIYFERKTGVQKEKNSKYFEKLVIQVWSNFY